MLLKYDICVLITRSENDRLNPSGLQAKMPPTRDGVEPMARYKAVGIELVEKPASPVAQALLAIPSKRVGSKPQSMNELIGPPVARGFLECK